MGFSQSVIVDDQFPCSSQGNPLFSSAHGQEIWVLLLEKAWAKIFGSYEKIEAGYTREALFALTGAPTKVFSIEDLKDQEAFDTLASADQKNFIMATGSNQLTKEQEEQLGLVEGHAYTIISCFNAEGHKLLLLRNPWGQTEWKGNWSDNSSLWTPSLRKICGHTTNANDGLFFMEYNDFKLYFSSFEICYYHDNYSYSFQKGKQIQLNQACCFEMQVSTAGEYFVSLHQKSQRFYANDTYEYSTVKLLLAKKGNNNTYEYVDGKMSRDYEFWIQATLNPGNYIIYVRPYWVGNNVQQTFTVSSYGPSKTIIKSIPKPNDFVSQVFLHRAKNPQKSTIQKDLSYEVYQDYKKGFGCFWARNDGTSGGLEVTAKFKETVGYLFKKPVQGFDLVFKLQPKEEKVAVFSIYNTARTTLPMIQQSVKQF